MTPTGKEEKAQSNFGLSRFFGVVTVNIDIVTTLLVLVCWGNIILLFIFIWWRKNTLSISLLFILNLQAIGKLICI